MCLGIGNQTLNDSLVKHVYSEPSKGEGEIAFRSRKCSFFLENTPGLCSECQSLLTTLYNIKDNFDNDKLDNDWTLSEFKQEEEAFNDNIITLNECSNCLKAFNNISSLNRHKLKCLNDSGDNEDKSDLIQEDEVFFEDNKIINECPKCLKTFNNTSSLNRHKRRCLKDPDFAKNKIICKSAIPSIECSICLKKLTHKGHLHHSKLHDKRMNLNEVIHCPLCGHSIDNRRLLNAHIHDSHDASKGCCGVCFEIVSNEYLSRHFEKHHNCNPKKNLCSECGKKFKLPSDLQNHIAYVHDVKGEKYVVCEQCGEVLPDLTVLKGHIRRLHKKTYTCHKCNKVFFENYRLKKHLKIHAGVKPYKCSRCNYCCVRKDNVFIHLRRVHKIIPTSNDVITIAEQIKLSESIIS
uniref:C2H2-type domain-containing protein n=1 Tax=Lepeophtheirus salmonis TaxID=72036 RepID=A0A0K2TDA3_LEPSM